MKLHHPDARGLDGVLRLGIQTQRGKVRAQAEWLAHAWGDKCLRAKSYKILSLQHTNYEGEPQAQETGYAHIEVQYFSTEREGTRIVSGLPLPD